MLRGTPLDTSRRVRAAQDRDPAEQDHSEEELLRAEPSPVCGAVLPAGSAADPAPVPRTPEGVAEARRHPTAVAQIRTGFRAMDKV